MKQSKGKPLYTFYDGPPFATGKPHYGHLLAGTIKDTVTRYWHQNGYHVERRFGWDTHGLPVEHEIDKGMPSWISEKYTYLFRIRHQGTGRCSKDWYC